MQRQAESVLILGALGRLEQDVRRAKRASNEHPKIGRAPCRSALRIGILEASATLVTGAPGAYLKGWR